MGPTGLFRRRTNPTKKEENNEWNEPTESIENETKVLNVNADFDSQTTTPKSILKRRELPISPLSASTQSMHDGDKYRRSTASVDTRSTMKSHDSLAFQSIPLPDWESAIDDKTNRKYYYNTLSRESQWTEPVDYNEKWNQYRQAINKYRQGHVTKNYTSEGLRKPGKSASSDKYATPEDGISISDATSSSSTVKTVRTRVETQISQLHKKKNSASDGIVRSRSKRFGIFSGRKNSNVREADTKKENTKDADTITQLPTRKESIFRKPKKLAFFTSSNMNPAHAHNAQQAAAEEPEWDKESFLKALEEHGCSRQDFITSGRSMQDLSIGKSFADSVACTDDCSSQFSNSRFSEVETQADEDETTYFTTGTDDDRTNFDYQEDGSYLTLETPASSFKSSYDRDDFDDEEEADERDGDGSMAEIKFAPSMHSELHSEISQPPPPPPTSNQKINASASKTGEHDDDTALPNAKSFISMTDYSTAVDTFATDADDSIGTGIETVVRARSFITAQTTRSLNDFKNDLIMGDSLLFGDSACRASCADVGEPIPMDSYRGTANFTKLPNKGKSRSMPRSKLRRHPQRMEL